MFTCEYNQTYNFPREYEDGFTFAESDFPQLKVYFTTSAEAGSLTAILSNEVDEIYNQCKEDNWYCVFNSLIELVKHIYNEPFTDKARYSISGVSMGGYALYSVIMVVPELFHKALVCCGGGMYWNACRMKDIKFRIFHGEQDVAVFPEESRRMYARLKEANADVALTI